VSGSPGDFVSSVVVYPGNSALLFTSDYEGGVRKSTDGGATWQDARAGLTGDLFFRVLVAGAPAALYAGGTPISGAGGGVFVSHDFGGHWSPSNSGLSNLSVQALAVDPESPATLYAGTAAGVFRSANGGQSWQPPASGLPAAQVVSIAVDAFVHSTVYAAVRNVGFYRSADAGAHWNAIDGGISDLRVVLGIAADASVPGRIFVTAYGNGICRRLKLGPSGGSAAGG